MCKYNFLKPVNYINNHFVLFIKLHIYFSIFVLFIKLTDLTSSGCYYNYNHYSEGDRILTNEPCLNCTCHNRMLMCYLRVCPFTKPIGQDCVIEKREDQCCPIITCPEGKFFSKKFGVDPY